MRRGWLSGVRGMAGGHIVVGEADRDLVELGEQLELLQRVGINGRFCQVHFDAEAAAQAPAALDHRVEALKAQCGHATGRGDLDLFAVHVDANNYGELVAGQCVAFHQVAATLQRPPAYVSDVTYATLRRCDSGECRRRTSGEVRRRHLAFGAELRTLMRSGRRAGPRRFPPRVCR
jgi:hypothetical protein